MEQQWPTEERLHKIYNNKDKCPAFISHFAMIVLDKSERVGGTTAYKQQKAISNRRRRIAWGTPTDAEIEAGLRIVED